MNKIDGQALDAGFKHEVAARPGGENLQLCYACGTCTAGCPVAEVDPDFSPRKIIRQVLLGMREQVLGSAAIWRCAQCYACTAKCPQNVRFREIARVLREMAVEAGKVPPESLGLADQIGRLTAKLRRDMAEAMVADPARFQQMQASVTSLTADS